MIVDIRHRLHGKSIFRAEAPTLKQALTDAVERALAARKYSADSEFLGSSYGTLHLSGADLAGADLRGADLRFVDLSLADLRGADLREAELYQTTFYGADLRRSDLRGTNLDCAHLANHSPPFEKAFLTGAQLTGCQPGSNWRSRQLLLEILRQAAGNNREKLRAADRLSIHPETQGDEDLVNWRQWEQERGLLSDWILDTLAPYAEEDSLYTPALMKKRSTKSKPEA